VLLLPPSVVGAFWHEAEHIPGCMNAGACGQHWR
jgi:hypothetical protein